MLIKQDNCITVKDVVERNTGLHAEEFLFPQEMPMLYGLDEAAACLFKHKNEPVTIVGDYDCDGICATAIIYHGLRKLGIQSKTRLPHRMSEGYGLSEKIIDEIKSGVVITVDNGIAAHQAIKKAKEKGLTVIVTDHHLAPRNPETNERILPEADVIVDPNAEDKTKYKEYCGAGIALRFIQELLPEEDHLELVILAAIATVADVMKLVGANRQLVIHGLKAINSGQGVTGLQGLLEHIGMAKDISEDDFGFKLGPIFNASGRLLDNGSELVLDVLKAETRTQDLEQKIARICELNEQRKIEVKEALPVARKLAANRRPIVIYHPSFKEGLIGIIAGQLAEEYQCPVIVFTKTETGNLKGSGRSVPGIHLKDTLDRMQERILKYGGHESAAGLTISGGTLAEFREAFTKACGPLKPISTDVCYDLELSPANLKSAIEELKEYAPYGEGNPRPTFHIRFDVKNNYRRIGDGSHMMIKGKALTLLGFGMSQQYEEAGFPEHISCVGFPKENWFNNRCYYKFELDTFEPV